VTILSACLAAPITAERAEGAQATPATTENGSATPAPQAPRKRPPLLREGGLLSRAVGSIREDTSRGEWIFVPAQPDPTGLERQIVLLPNGVLEEAIRVLRVAPEPLIHEVSGEIFVYRGRNYLLASIIAPMVAPIGTSVAPPAPTQPAAGAAPAQGVRPLKDIDEESLAAELERRLAERIGAVPAAPVAPSGAAVGSALDGSSASPPRRGAMPADIRIQSRRGHLARDAATGGWRFVFVGQTADGGEPSMPVLPCLALERVERLVRESDLPPTLLVSGTTTLFEGRTFLLPSGFRIATGGKGIDP
jgi:hypothetical protein